MAPRVAPLLIVLNDENKSKVYTYGSTISGVVKVDTSSKSTHVTVSLKAKHTTQITKTYSTGLVYQSETHTAKVYLLNDTVELYSGGDISSSASAEDGFVFLPFTFTFPSKVQLAPSTRAPFNSNAIFEHLPGHPLPPTLKREIKYYLEARMAKTSRKWFDPRSEKKVRHSLAFSPPCNDPSWASQPLKPEIFSLTRQSRWLHDDSPNEHHNFRSRTRDLVNHSSDPAATFTIITNVPAVARAGYTLPVTVSLAHASHSDDLPDSPAVFLRGFRVVLRSTKVVRVPFRSIIWGDSEWQQKIKKSFKLMQRRWNGKHDTPPPLLPAGGEELALVEFCHDGSVVPTEKVPPTFKTYGLVTTYKVKVVLWVECAGKTWKVKKVKAPVTILGWPDAEAEEAAPPLVGNR